MKYTDLPCICCGRDFTPEEGAGPGWETMPPYEGTIFTAHGNYGSTLWDPPPHVADYLLVIVCDDCLRQAGRNENVMVVRPVRPARPPDAQEPWDPES